MFVCASVPVCVHPCAVCPRNFDRLSINWINLRTNLRAIHGKFALKDTATVHQRIVIVTHAKVELMYECLLAVANNDTLVVGTYWLTCEVEHRTVFAIVSVEAADTIGFITQHDNLYLDWIWS